MSSATIPRKDPLAPAALTAFHAGDRAALELCYREHFAAVSAAVARIMRGADAESVVHDVFYRVLSDGEMRASFRGGNLGAWLARVATNGAIDYARRRGREVPVEDAERGRALDAQHAGEQDDSDAKMLLARFRRDHLPADLHGVLEARFLRQLTQREAARELGVPRTTLVYQEQRVRALLEKFLLGKEEVR